MDWNWVTPRIALGSAPRASDVSRMQQQGITDVLDLRGEPNQGETGPQPDMYYGTGINYYYVPMHDRGGIQPVSVYQQGVGIMQSVLSDPTRKILVHCQAGEYRSPSMVYAYLRSVGFTSQDAWTLIRTARPVVQTQYISSAEAAVPYLPSPPSMTAGQVAALVALVGGTIALSVWASRRGVKLFQPSWQR